MAPRERVHPGFLLWAPAFSSSQSCFSALSKGATFREITLDMLRWLSAPLPPLVEQQLISEYPDRETAKIDALIARVREAIERLKEYRVALISAAVTGKIDVHG